MTPEDEARLVIAIENIGLGLMSIAESYKRDVDHRYPPKKEPREAVITRVPTDEDLIKEAHGSDAEDWIGPRESAFLEKD